MAVGEGIVALRVPMEDYELPTIERDHEELEDVSLFMAHFPMIFTRVKCMAPSWFQNFNRWHLQCVLTSDVIFRVQDYTF